MVFVVPLFVVPLFSFPFVVLEGIYPSSLSTEWFSSIFTLAFGTEIERLAIPLWLAVPLAFATSRFAITFPLGVLAGLNHSVVVARRGLFPRQVSEITPTLYMPTAPAMVALAAPLAAFAISALAQGIDVPLRPIKTAAW